jgi:hypothetical protein
VNTAAAVVAVVDTAAVVVAVAAVVVTVINFLKQFQRAAFRNGRRSIHFAAKIFDSLFARQIG